MVEFSVEEENFQWRGRISVNYLKIDQKFNKSFFLTENKEQQGTPPPQDLTPYIKVFVL